MNQKMYRCVAMVLGLAVALSAKPAFAGGGNVLPPTAKPSGYSLAAMADALAYFSTSFNDPAYYPKTPFQILYLNGTNSFTVKTGTQFFVPLLFITDSPPLLGDFPADASETAAYYFSEEELGLNYAEIEVDGKVTSLSPDYAAGPTNSPGLLDGGGSHYTQLGAFLTPLSKGTHTVTIRFYADGDALDPFGGVFEFENTYTVIVK